MLQCLCCLAGYNNVDVAEFLLENGADVNAQDKGGLIPLHNASSYGVSRVYVAVVMLIVYMHQRVNCTSLEFIVSERMLLLTEYC